MTLDHGDIKMIPQILTFGKFFCKSQNYFFKKHFFLKQPLIKRYTSNQNYVYAFALKYPADTLKISMSAPFPTYNTNVTLLGYNGIINWTGNFDKGGIVIDLNNLDWSKYTNNLALAFKITNLK